MIAAVIKSQIGRCLCSSDRSSEWIAVRRRKLLADFSMAVVTAVSKFVSVETIIDRLQHTGLSPGSYTSRHFRQCITMGSTKLPIWMPAIVSILDELKPRVVA
jgi:hypothetical protein